MRLLRCMLFALLLSSAAALCAQTAAPADAAQVSALSAEVTELRHENALMWRYDQRMLNTVNYAMLAVIFVATAGSVISFVNANRELTALRRDIETGLQNAVDRLEMNAGKHLGEIDNRIEEHFRQSSDSIGKFEEQMNARAEALRESLHESVEQSRKLAAENLRKAIARQKFELARLACEIHHDGRHPNSSLHLLRAQIEVLEARLEMESAGSNGSYIQEMAKTLERPELRGLNDAEYDRVLNLLDVVTTSNPGDSSRLLAALIAARNAG